MSAIDRLCDAGDRLLDDNDRLRAENVDLRLALDLVMVAYEDRGCWLPEMTVDVIRDVLSRSTDDFEETE